MTAVIGFVAMLITSAVTTGFVAWWIGASASFAIAALLGFAGVILVTAAIVLRIRRKAL